MAGWDNIERKEGGGASLSSISTVLRVRFVGVLSGMYNANQLFVIGVPNRAGSFSVRPTHPYCSEAWRFTKDHRMKIGIPEKN